MLHTWLKWKLLALLLFITIFSAVNGLDDPSNRDRLLEVHKNNNNNNKNKTNNNVQHNTSDKEKNGIKKDKKEGDEHPIAGGNEIGKEGKEGKDSEGGGSYEDEEEEGDKQFGEQILEGEQKKEGEQNKEGENKDIKPYAQHCISEGVCSKCERFERSNAYCDKTGYKLKITCTDVNDPSKKDIQFESCHGEGETRGVYLYEAMAFGFFILSCYAVRIRRAKLVQQQADKIAKQIGSV